MDPSRQTVVGQFELWDAGAPPASVPERGARDGRKVHAGGSGVWGGSSWLPPTPPRGLAPPSPQWEGPRPGQGPLTWGPPPRSPEQGGLVEDPSHHAAFPLPPHNGSGGDRRRDLSLARSGPAVPYGGHRSRATAVGAGARQRDSGHDGGSALSSAMDSYLERPLPTGRAPSSRRDRRGGGRPTQPNYSSDDTIFSLDEFR